jgi:hypothetical protein
MPNHTKSEPPSPTPKETEKPEKKKREKKGGMSLTEQRSHRMKMMSRVRKGMSINKAHKDIMK